MQDWFLYLNFLSDFFSDNYTMIKLYMQALITVIIKESKM